MRNVLLLSLIFFCFSAKSQHLRLDTLNKRTKGIYAELLGAGGVFSANYDTRFSRRQDGAGIRAGMSYVNTGGISLFTLPVQVNYLLGKNDRYLEIGLGGTYTSAALNFGASAKTGPTAFGTMCIGYRLQPKNEGLMFRAGFSPIFGKDFFKPYFPHISFGYSF